MGFWSRFWTPAKPLGSELPPALPVVAEQPKPIARRDPGALQRAFMGFLATIDFALQPLRDKVRSDASSTWNPLTGSGGGSDKGAAARPNLWRIPLSPQETLTAFNSSGLTRRVCELFPSHGSRNGFTIAVADAKDKDRAKKIEKLAAEIPVGGTDSKGIKAAQFFGGTWANRDGTCLFIGVFDEENNSFDRDGRPCIRLDLPPKKINKVLALQPAERAYVSVLTWDGSLASETYFQPMVWNVVRVLGGGPLAIHASRVLWFRGAIRSPMDLFSNAGFDISMIDLCWDTLRNKEQIGNVGATIAQELSQIVLQVAGKQGLGTEDMSSQYLEGMSLFAMSRAVGSVAVIGEGDSVQQVGSTVTGFKDLAEESWRALGATLGAPQTVLVGEAPSGLSTDGESQRGNWHAAVHAYQEMHAERTLRHFLSWVWEAEGGAPEDWKIEWNSLEEMTEAQRAEVVKMWAESSEKFAKIGALTPLTIAESLFGGETFRGQINLRDEDRKEADELGNLALAAQELGEMNASAQGAGSPANGGGTRSTPGGENV